MKNWFIFSVLLALACGFTFSDEKHSISASFQEGGVITIVGIPGPGSINGWDEIDIGHLETAAMLAGWNTAQIAAIRVCLGNGNPDNYEYHQLWTIENPQPGKPRCICSGDGNKCKTPKAPVCSGGGSTSIVITVQGN